jgi:REP element-mobilizing transposase RayT
MIEPGGFYHVTSRGNNREPICLDAVDFSDFEGRLGIVAARHDLVVLGHCVMTNHYHLFVRVPGSALSQAISELNGRFAHRANERHKRAGHLFQSRFHAERIARDEHLREVARYVVLNPVRAGLVRRPEQWEWSSYAACVGLEFPPPFLAVAELLRWFGKTPRLARAAYRSFVDDGLARCQAPGSTA